MTSVSDPIKLTVNIPEELQKTDRTFYLLSCYNGEATVVAQGTGSKLTWNADKFSTYLIAYKDPVDSNKDTNKDSSKDSSQDISKASVTLKTTKYTYSGKAKQPAVTVAFNGKNLVNNTDYTVQYSKNKAVGTAVVTITGKKTVTIKKKKTGSKKITGLKAKKKYYVKIRTYKKVGGKKYYSSWSKAKIVMTK